MLQWQASTPVQLLNEFFESDQVVGAHLCDFSDLLDAEVFGLTRLAELKLNVGQLRHQFRDRLFDLFVPNYWRLA